MSEENIQQGERAERCETCRFWQQSYEDLHVGQCRRYPPQMCDTVVRYYAKNPLVKHEYEESDTLAAAGAADPWRFPVLCFDDWCGEYKPLALPMVKDDPLDVLKLSKRLLNSLECAYKGPKGPITLISQLVQHTEADLLEIRNVGEESLREIRLALAALGLKLKGD